MGTPIQSKSHKGHLRLDLRLKLYFRLVLGSEGLQQTQLLATKYKEAAMESIREMRDSADKEKLAYIAEKVISRMN